MSKHELHRQATEQSGVSYEDSQVALHMKPSIYERVGNDGLYRLSSTFYDRVFNDDEKWFVSIFASSTKAEAIENQYTFFVQTFGGPPLYRERKGKYTRLVGRHAAFPIGDLAAQRWVYHMEESMKSLGDDVIPRELHAHLLRYFRFTAHYIVASLSYMKEDQLSGGNRLDEGKLW